MAAYLGFDVGTQSVKALLLDGDLQVVGTASHALRTLDGLPPGHSEQHPADWLEGLRQTAQALHRAHPALWAQVAAIGVSGQQHGLVPLDEAFAVIRPAKLWNDVASAPQCQAAMAALGGPAGWFRHTGNHLAPGFTGGKVRWLAEREPQHFARLRHVLLPHDYVNWWLTGAATCEAGDASGTGCFDVRQRRFDQAATAAIAPGLSAMLPRLVEAGAPAGELLGARARELGLGARVLVSHGGGDNMMAAIGAGAVEPGIAVLSLGTSGTVFACSDVPVCDPEGSIAGFCDSTGRWLPLGCTMNATVTTELTRNLLGLSLDAMELAATAAPAGAGGALCLPFFTGERSPNLPTGTGGFLGLTPHNMQPGHLARAAIEGATFALAALLDRLVTLGLKLHTLRVTGGGSRSALWCRIVAAATGHAVETGVHADAAALGAALQACWTHQRAARPGTAIGDVIRQARVLGGGAVLEPQADWCAIYRERRQAYAAAVAALTPCFDALAGGRR